MKTWSNKSWTLLAEHTCTIDQTPEDATVNLTSNSESKSKANAKIGTLLAKTAPSRSMDTKKGQKQKTLNTFFGVPRPKK